MDVAFCQRKVMEKGYFNPFTIISINEASVAQ